MPKMITEKWEEVSEGFTKYANFPNCVGAIDGKHIRIIQAPCITATKSTFLQCCQLYVAQTIALFLWTLGDMKKADSTAFQESLLYKKLMESSSHIPNPKPLSDVSLTPLPYVFVGDDAFGISEHIMRPYSGKSLTHTKKMFNYRLSRARRFTECAFGIMANKWRIFHRPMNVNIDFAECIIRACCVLHNFVILKDGYNYEDILYDKHC